MLRMNAETGGAMEEMEHLEQSVRDVLLTPIGTRVMRRRYGSRLMSLLDQPMNDFLIASIQAAVVEALSNYEPRVKLSRVTVNGADSGRLSITIEGFYVPDSRAIRLENISLQ